MAAADTVFRGTRKWRFYITDLLGWSTIYNWPCSTLYKTVIIVPYSEWAQSFIIRAITISLPIFQIFIEVVVAIALPIF